MNEPDSKYIIYKSNQKICQSKNTLKRLITDWKELWMNLTVNILYIKVVKKYVNQRILWKDYTIFVSFETQILKRIKETENLSTTCC